MLCFTHNYIYIYIYLHFSIFVFLDKYIPRPVIFTAVYKMCIHLHLNNPEFLCLAAAGLPVWPKCHRVPWKSLRDLDLQEVPIDCNGHSIKHSDQNMNLCWTEIKRKSHNIRYNKLLKHTISEHTLTFNIFCDIKGLHSICNVICEDLGLDVMM